MFKVKFKQKTALYITVIMNEKYVSNYLKGFLEVPPRPYLVQMWLIGPSLNKKVDHNIGKNVILNKCYFTQGITFMKSVFYHVIVRHLENRKSDIMVKLTSFG